MYWLTPFKYLLEGFLALLVTGQEIRCETQELAIFPPPPGQSCDSYAGQYAQQAGGYVQTQPDGNCGFCQFATGDAFAASFNVFPKYIWRDFGTSLPPLLSLTFANSASRHHVGVHPL
jgi:ATP-binding cassette subfamily G (WHITE) protein 2 (SNQ2)